MPHTIDVEHHFPLWWSYTLMETEPDFSSTAQWMVVAVWRTEETPPDWRVCHAWQMAHHHIQCQNGIVWNLSGAPLKRLFQIEQWNLCQPFDRNAKHTILPFAGQRYFQLQTIIADGQWIACVQIVATVEDGLQHAKQFTVRMDHGFDNFTIDLAWTFVRLNVDVIVVNETAWHGNLKVIGAQQNGPTLMAKVWSSRACEYG